MTNQDNRSKAADDLRQKAEAFVREQASRTPEDSAALSPEEIQQTLHELRVHQIELEMQNDELRTAQARIEAERARYFDLYDLAPVGYCTLSKQGLILETNLTAATLLCMARGELINLPIFHFILKNDRDIYYLHRKKLFETCEPQECELRLVKPDGAFFWGHLTGTAAQEEDGAIVCRVVISDITERKRAEENLCYQKQLLEIIINGTWDVLAIQYPDRTIERFNQAGYDLFGLPPNKVNGRKCFEPFLINAPSTDCDSKYRHRCLSP